MFKMPPSASKQVTHLLKTFLGVEQTLSSYTGCIKMIGVVLKLIIFTSMVNRIINTSRNERVTQQVYDTCLQMFDVCTLALSHSFHAFFWQTRPSCTFSFRKAPSCLKLLIAASNANGRWGITAELSTECPLKRNNWFMLHKMQYTKRFLLRSCNYRFVPSQTEREEGSGIAHAHKTWTPAVSLHMGNLLLCAFWKL